MNWKEIKEKYPKAWGLIVNSKKHDISYYLYNRYELQLDDEQVCADYSDRDLYDFFDENGVIVTIRYISSLKAFRYRIHIDSKITDWRPTAKNPSEIKSRTEAETEAFKKAFQILEEKL